ncbi:MAG: stage II sporulation protein M [Nitrososphaeraceae archaeon]
MISFNLGAKIDLSNEQSKSLKEEFEKKTKDINEYGIFMNNLLIALGMFIPGFGVGLGVFSGFGTGLVFSAFTTFESSLQNISPLSIIVTPFGIMEIFSYGLAMSRSGMIIYDLIVKKISWKHLIKPSLIEIVLVIIILFIAAFIEWAMIEQITKFNK